MAQAAIIDKCDLCDAEEQVGYYCVNCQEILCLTCKSSHSKSRKTRNDTIIPLSQARRDDLIQTLTPVFCSDHSTVEVTLFCLKCDTLICNQCLAGKHKGHVPTTQDEIKDAKIEKLKKVIETLKAKQSIYDNAIDIESQVHIQFSNSIDKVRDEISDQKNKIIEELNVLCDEQNAELTKFQQNEDKRYADACNKIQAQNQTVTSTLQAAQKIITNNNVAQIIQTTKDATNTINGLEETTLPCAKIATYQSGDRSRAAISEVQGKVNIKQVSTPEKKTETDKKKVPVKIQQQQRSDDHKQRQGINTAPIDVSKVTIKSTLQITDRKMGRIDVIVPLKNKTAWVVADKEKYLSLIDREGKIITTSVEFDKNIFDAKEYSRDLLVTCYELCIIFTMSEEGKTVSSFSDLTPYKTRGLCINNDMNVVVCLRSTKDYKDNKVVMLGRSGDIIQSIQYSDTGVPQFKDPWRVTSLPSGEIIVIDWDHPNKMIGVKGEEPNISTWDCKIGKEVKYYILQSITSDGSNIFVTDNALNRVYDSRKDGRVMCLIENAKEIVSPYGIALDKEGHLWVGCESGKIHIIKYR